MNDAQTNEPVPRKPLRLWPGVVIVILQWLVRFGVPVIAPESMGFAIIGGMIGGLAVVVWWLFFSRARWFERLGTIALMIVGLFATSRLVHESIQNGMMGMMLVISSLPFLSLALVLGAALGRRLADGARRVAMAAAILLACGIWTLVRTGGMTGDANSDFHWRWSKTPEERLLAQAGEKPVPLAPVPATAKFAAD